MGACKRIAGRIGILLAALFFWIEESIWKGAKALAHRLTRNPAVARAETWLALQNPYVCLLFFVLPVLALLPFNLAATWLLAHHHVFLGAVVIVAAKVTGTGIGFRLLQITEPRLMTLRWFAVSYTAVLRAKAWIKAQLEAIPGYRAARAALDDLKHRAAALWAAFLARLRGQPQPDPEQPN